MQGKKTLELRTWSVSYRGTLIIHASQTIDRDACLTFNMDPDQVTTGALIGTVELVGIDELSEAQFKQYGAEHLAAKSFHYRSPLYGWRIMNPHMWEEPVPMRGRMSLFNVQNRQLPTEVRTGGDNNTTLQLSVINTLVTTDESRMPTPARMNLDTPFQLRVINSAGRTGSYRLALYQHPLSRNGSTALSYIADQAHMLRISELGADVLRAISDHVLDALRKSGYRATDLHANRREPFQLGEETGVRLGLLFMALKPVTKGSRIEAISQGLRKMTSEECYYWYSKCIAATSVNVGDDKAHERAQRALRVLLANE